MFLGQSGFDFSVPVSESARILELASAAVHSRRGQKKTRAEIKAAGGEEYERVLAKERDARARFRERHPDYRKKNPKHYGRHGGLFKTRLVARARQRARKRGLPATVTAGDLIWPTHCPVLGIELDYPERIGVRKTQVPKGNWPSLDRMDPDRGYVPGNVFVISFRANTLKNNATLDEILRIAAYIGAANG